MKKRKSSFFKYFGPGFITGAADDDPSGIATYSQAGAQFGFGQLWLALFMLPLITVTQEACSRIGVVTGKGIVAVIKEHYSKKLLNIVVILILIANTINIGADLGAMAAAAQLIIPGSLVFFSFTFAFIIIMLEVFICYATYSKILKWLCLFLLCYPLTIVMIDVPWRSVLKSTFIPSIQFDFEFLFLLIAVLGTTISPYLFIWQPSEIVEDQLEHLRKYHRKIHICPQYIGKIRIDNFLGMLFSEICTWSIILVTAIVLHENGVTDIKTAADAAKALEPFVHSFTHAGYIAKIIFSIGIIGLGFLAIPILAGSSAYAVTEAMRWKHGLNYKFAKAKAFYTIIIMSTFFGLLLNFIGVNPVKALIYAAVINGIVAVPLIYVIAKIAKDSTIMGIYKSGIASRFFIAVTFFSMLMAAVAMLMTFFW